MEIKIHTGIEDISPESWRNLSTKNNPFIQHEFLLALERNHCVGEKLGWLPVHIAAYEDTELVAAMPAYIKDNSYGELVFDWSWADAYQRAGLAYYPKLVSAIPYTPAQGPRLLVVPGKEKFKNVIVRAAVEFASQQQFSTFHCLFPDAEDLQVLGERGLLLRQGVQFHWQNQSYKDFDDYLARMTSRKRKNIKKERRVVEQAGIEIRVFHGPELDHQLWQELYPFYRDTFLQKGGLPTLTQGFFEEVSRTMGDSIIVIAAMKQNQFVAASIFFAGGGVLYGRHWGCNQQYKNLHFEMCYYQGIEYAIAKDLKLFEPGAQGEYKVSRGFVPTTTWSAHWIENKTFHNAIAEFLQRENAYLKNYRAELSEELPFRQDEAG